MKREKGDQLWKYSNGTWCGQIPLEAHARRPSLEAKYWKKKIKQSTKAVLLCFVFFNQRGIEGHATRLMSVFPWIMMKTLKISRKSEGFFMSYLLNGVDDWNWIARSLEHLQRQLDGRIKDSSTAIQLTGHYDLTRSFMLKVAEHTSDKIGIVTYKINMKKSERKFSII